MSGGRVVPTKTDGKVAAMAKRIATEAPGLEDLSEEQLEQVARVVMAEQLKKDMAEQSKLAGIDYPAERETFLELARRRSAHTERAYRRAMGLYDEWCERLNVHPLALDAAGADDWTASMIDVSPATVHLRVNAASAFWTWIERRHAGLRNPFRGTRARPKLKPVRELVVPSAKEIETMKAEAPPLLRAAIVVMSELGLRVGGVCEMTVNRGRYQTTSKGQQVSGELPDTAKKAITSAGLPLRYPPFGTENAGGLADRFRYLVGKLYAAGAIAHRYSVHDLRHAFAIRIYTDTNDIYLVSKRLAHASVNTTERYLRSLGLVNA
jgi:site-specific recombinase XerD